MPPTEVRADHPGNTPGLDEPIAIDFDLSQVPVEMRAAITSAVAHKPKGLLDGQEFAVVSFRLLDNWAFGTLAVIDNAPDDVGIGDNGALIILRKNNDDVWVAGLEGTEKFIELLLLAPENVLDSTAKQSLNSSGPQVRNPLLANMKFPWDHTQSWTLTQGWHSGNNVDFAPSSSEPNKWLLAASDGIVTHICNIGEVSANVQVKHSDGTITTYLHLDKNTVPNSILGTYISQGQELGRLIERVYDPGPCGSDDNYCRSGSWYCLFRDACGCSTGPHVHFGVPSRNVTIDGWTSHSNNNWTQGQQTKSPKSLFNSSNVRNANNTPSCPDDSNGVILYQHSNYDCGGQGENSGYVRRNSPGIVNNVGGGFNDKASSVRVPSGWSVKLYQHDNRNGASACHKENDENFWGDDFNNGVSLNDQVTSFEVFNSPMCGEKENRPPYRPSPQEPDNGYVATNDLAPTLSWLNNGDPDGNSVEFYAEVYDSPVNANSGWISNFPWRPSQLDGHYHTYKWRVKSRDDDGAESGWSDTREFTIEAPNQPPSISFNTANGNSFPTGWIESNDSTWEFQGTARDVDGSITQIQYHCPNSVSDDCGYRHSQSGLSSWTYEQRSLSGQNDIYFKAKDNEGSVAYSRHLDLRIDLAKPSTTVSLNNEGNPANWPTWFRQSVQVRLKATDHGTGRFTSGINKIRYRIDGGSWQTRNGSNATFTLSSDGTHTVQYYALDKVGNQESIRTVTFKIDRTRPTPPSGINETHGVVSKQWQKNHDTPTFTWNPSTDATSGLWGYQFYFGTDANGTSNHKTLLASDPRQWEPRPNGAATGTYYLRGRTRDHAGNWSNWVDLFTFRYDGTPPHNPEVSNDDGRVSGVWQNNIRTADFSWQPAQDTGSGVAGYYIYWGPDENGTSTSLSSANEFVSSTPICGENKACTHYLRLQTEDNVGWKSEWVTAFALRYDNAPPTVDLVANYGQPSAHQTPIRLDITTTDEGSGAQQMRLSNEGTTWSDWLPLENTIYWDIPNVGRRDYDILIQVADAIPNLSEVMSDTVFLDVNQPKPKSENFWLWTNIWDAGGDNSNSPSYQLRSTVGQSFDAPILNSVAYRLFSGYQAGTLAEPTIPITYTHYSQLGQVIASAGTPGDGLHSNRYQLMGTLGQSAHVETISGIRYTIDSGYWGGMLPSEPSEEPPPPPPPPPPSEADCEYFQLTINNGALYSNDAGVKLNLCGPYVSEVKLSNDGGFGGGLWQPYTTTIPWTLDVYNSHVLPRLVYAQFKDEQGQIHGNFFDDIIYDPNPPTNATIAVGDNIPQALALRSLSRDAESEKNGVIRVANMRYTERVGEQVLAQPLPLLAPDANGTVDLYLSASDDNSGVTEMQISATSAFTDTDWQSYSAYQAWTPQGSDGVKTVYARFRDSAGNASEPVEASFVLDTLSPLGGLAFSESVVGSDFITTTVYLGSQDNLTGVTDMRISTDPTFSDAPWQAYSTTLTFPLSITTQSEESVYLQYRDAMGNISDVYSETYLVDSTPPVIYVEVAAAKTLTRTVTVLSYDVMAQVETMHLSNDPLMIENVVTLPYTESVEWVFDERKIVWVQVEDSVGNLSEPYPAYIGQWLSSMSMQPGWNHISWPLSPQVSYTAESLCEEMNGQGGNIVEIDRWHNGGWDGHLCGLSFNDFEIEMGRSYFIKSNATSNWSMEGYQVTEAVSLTLQVGWNPIAISHTDAYSAESLCDDIIAQGVSVVEIDRWHNGGWEGHICGLPFNDFNIERGTGYFIKSESSGSVKPSELPTSLPQRTAEEAHQAPDDMPTGKAMPVRDLRISNLRDTSLTLSWITDEPTTGYVRFSRDNLMLPANSSRLSAQERVAVDIRGASTNSRTHVVGLTNLKPETSYQLHIISGAETAQEVLITTAPTLESVPESDTIYGKVFQADGTTPAAGALVYLTVKERDGAGDTGEATLLSTLVAQNGYWHANLGNARTADLTRPFSYSASGDKLLIEVQGADSGAASQTVDTNNDQQVPDIILGETNIPTSITVNTLNATPLSASLLWPLALLGLTTLALYAHRRRHN